SLRVRWCQRGNRSHHVLIWRRWFLRGNFCCLHLPPRIGCDARRLHAHGSVCIFVGGIARRGRLGGRSYSIDCGLRRRGKARRRRLCRILFSRCAYASIRLRGRTFLRSLGDRRRSCLNSRKFFRCDVWPLNASARARLASSGLNGSSFPTVNSTGTRAVSLVSLMRWHTSSPL